MPRPTCVYYIPQGNMGQSDSHPVLGPEAGGDVMWAGWGRWRKGGGTLSWASTIPSTHLSPLLAAVPLSTFLSSLSSGPPLFLRPGPSATVSASLSDGPKSPSSSSRIWEAPGFPLPVPALNPTQRSPVWPHSYLLSCGLHTCSSFPSPKHILLCAFKPHLS